MHPVDSSASTRTDAMRFVATIALVTIGLFGYMWFETENKRAAEARAQQERVDLFNVHVVEFIAKSMELAAEGDYDPVMRDLVKYSRTFVGPTIKPLVLQRYGEEKAPRIFALAEEFGNYEKTQQEARSAAKAHEAKVERLRRDEERLAELKRENKRQSFIVQRRFDTNSEGKGIYEAFDADHTRTCVLIADDETLQGVNNLQATQLHVKYLGEQPMKVKKFNAFQNFDATEYVPTYTTTAASQDIITLSRSTLRDRAELAGIVDPAAEALMRNTTYFNTVAELVRLLDDRYLKFTLAEKVDVVKSPLRRLFFKDGTVEERWGEHGDRERFFDRPSMTVEEAKRYARLLGAKEEHFAKSRKGEATIEYYSPTGGVTLFLDHGKVNQVMSWIPTKVLQQQSPP